MWNLRPKAKTFRPYWSQGKNLEGLKHWLRWWRGDLKHGIGWLSEDLKIKKWTKSLSVQYSNSKFEFKNKIDNWFKDGRSSKTRIHRIPLTIKPTYKINIPKTMFVLYSLEYSKDGCIQRI